MSNCFQKWLYQFALLQIAYKEFPLAHNLANIAIVRLLIFAYLLGECDFKVHFPD